MSKILALILLVAFVSFSAWEISAQTTAFTYQGSLASSGLPVNGNYDFEFRLFDSVIGTTQLGSTLQRLNVAVANGIFTVTLDFGSTALPGADRFLEIAVRTAGGPTFTQLNPRQQVSSAPYSIRSLNSATADTANNSSQLGGVAANQYVVTTDPRMTDARAPTSGSPNYIQNQNAGAQAASNFNISGNGTAGGTFRGDIIRADTQFNIGGSRVLSVPGTGDLFVGVAAGSANSTGTNNSFFGIAAGNTNTTGSNNTVLGYNTDVGANNLTNATAIGAEARVDCSNCMVLGGVAGINGASSNINVGIGTTSPDTKFEIVNDNGTAPHIFTTSYGTSNSAIIGRQADGTFAAPTATTSGRTLLFLGGRGNTGAGFATTSRVGISFEASQDWTATNTGTRILFETTSNLSAARAERMRIDQNGRVGIGTTTPVSMLDVSGSINSDAQYNLNGIRVLRIEGTNNLFAGPTGGVTTGTDNSFFGYNAGTSNTSGSGNSYLGRSAGFSNSSGDFNTAIGYQATTASNASYSTAIGAFASVFDSHRIQLGSSSETVAIGGLAAASGTHLCINGDNVLSSCSSSRRYKDNIRILQSGLNVVSKLIPVTFDWKGRSETDLGLIAEEVAEVEPLLVTHNKTGAIEGVKYDQLSVVLINAVKEQQALIELQQKQNKELKKQIDGLKTVVCSMKPDADVCKTSQDRK